MAKQNEKKLLTESLEDFHYFNHNYALSEYWRDRQALDGYLQHYWRDHNCLYREFEGDLDDIPLWLDLMDGQTAVNDYSYILDYRNKSS